MHTQRGHSDPLDTKAFIFEGGSSRENLGGPAALQPAPPQATTTTPRQEKKAGGDTRFSSSKPNKKSIQNRILEMQAQEDARRGKGQLADHRAPIAASSNHSSHHATVMSGAATLGGLSSDDGEEADLIIAADALQEDLKQITSGAADGQPTRTSLPSIVEEAQRDEPASEKATAGALVLMQPDGRALRSNNVVPNSTAVAKLPDIHEGRRTKVRPVAGLREPLHQARTAREWIDAVGQRRGVAGMEATLQQQQGGGEQQERTLAGDLVLPDETHRRLMNPSATTAQAQHQQGVMGSPSLEGLMTSPRRGNTPGHRHQPHDDVERPQIGTATLPMTGELFSSFEDAKLRRQIFALCHQMSQKATAAVHEAQVQAHFHRQAQGQSPGAIQQHGSFNTFAFSDSVDSRLRKDSKPPVEVIVKEFGEVVWQSAAVALSDQQVASQAADPKRQQQLQRLLLTNGTGDQPSSGGALILQGSYQQSGGDGTEEDGDVDGHNGGDRLEIDALVDEDLAQVRKRAHRAFKKTVSTFKAKIQEQAKEIHALKEDKKESQPGGRKYEALQQQLEAYRHQISQMSDKIKSLVKLLEKAGATIKNHEHQKEMENRSTLGGKKGDGHTSGANLDWTTARRVVPDLIIEDREPHAILRDVTDYVERINTKVGELEASNDMFADKFADKDQQCELLGRERDSLQVKLRLSEGTVTGLREQTDHLEGEITSLKDKMEQQRRAHEAERDRLIYQAMEIEKSIRKAVEIKPFFIGLGKGLSVPPYLRFEGKVKNLDLPKKEVEDIINLIWAKRDGGYAIKRATRAVNDFQQRVLGTNMLVALDDGKSGDSLLGDKKSPLPPGDVLEELVDYDNVRYVRRLPGSATDHVTTFLLDRFSTNDDGDGDTKRKRKGAAAEKQLPGPKEFRKYGFSVPAVVAEVAYSLIEGCEKFKYDADVELFRRIVKQDIPELVYYDQMVMLVKLKAALLHAGKTTNGLNGSATFSTIIKACEKFFTVKTEDSLDQLRRALVVEIPDGTAMDETKVANFPLSINRLFASNEHGNQGSFMEAVRDQHLEEACMYASEVSGEISSCVTDDGKASLAEIRSALSAIDPLKPIEDINRFLLRVMAVYCDKDADIDAADEASGEGAGDFDGTIHLNQRVDCERFSQASKQVFTKRYGPREDPSAFIQIDAEDAEQQGEEGVEAEESGVADASNEADDNNDDQQHQRKNKQASSGGSRGATPQTKAKVKASADDDGVIALSASESAALEPQSSVPSPPKGSKRSSGAGRGGETPQSGSLAPPPKKGSDKRRRSKSPATGGQ